MLKKEKKESEVATNGLQQRMRAREILATDGTADSDGQGNRLTVVCSFLTRLSLLFFLTTAVLWQFAHTIKRKWRHMGTVCQKPLSSEFKVFVW